jgi:Tfp pilus assembly protein PilF
VKINNPRKGKKSTRPSESVQWHAMARWLVPAAVALATFASFLPVLSNGFVEWDDYENLTSNPDYRGLGWNQLRWMFTTFHMGPYQPLSWLTLGLDYLLWGMNPTGYHLTSLLIHAANGVVFYFLCRRLLIAALSVGSEKSWLLSFSSGVAALLFALHPLRVESVAWATERRDVLSGWFFLCTVYCYLRANLNQPGDGRRRLWIGSTLVFSVLSLLSKAITMTLPLVLLILDIYPLRRLPWNPRQWFLPEARGILREKIPFVIVALPFGLLALHGQRQAAALTTLESFDLSARFAQALFGASFYLWKTLVPARLSPLYEIPPDFSLWHPWILAGAATTVIISLFLFSLRDRWPGGLACWLYSIVVLAPVLGVIKIGPQLVAERYSYLSCLSWAVLAGGVLLHFTGRSVRDEGMTISPGSALIVAGSISVMLATLTWQQTMVWRDTETLWSHVLKRDPKSSMGHYNLGKFLAAQGKHTEAITHYRQALSIRPGDADAHNNLGLLLAIREETDGALEEFHKALAINPNYARAYFNIGRVFARQGQLEKAVEKFQQALRLRPDEIEIHLGLGSVLARQGRLAAATAQFREAVKLEPGFADAHVALARSLEAEGKKDEAVMQYQEALHLLKSQKRTSQE